MDESAPSENATVIPEYRQRSAIKKYSVRLADQNGSDDGRVRKLTIDADQNLLTIQGVFSVPIQDVLSASVKNARVAELRIMNPQVNNGQLVYIRFTVKNFFNQPVPARLNEITAELTTFAENANLRQNRAVDTIRVPVQQAQYAFGISFLIVFYYRVWYGFDPRRTIILKTVSLMIFNGIFNCCGVLLLALPYFNWLLQKNLLIHGWRKRSARILYFATILPGFFLWLWILYGLLFTKS